MKKVILVGMLLTSSTVFAGDNIISVLTGTGPTESVIRSTNKNNLIDAHGNVNGVIYQRRVAPQVLLGGMAQTNHTYSLSLGVEF